MKLSMISTYVAVALYAILAIPASAQSVKVVGVGASTCQQYLEETRDNLPVQREFISWAQGYLSGLLIRAPAGVDETLDLNPPGYPLLRQAEYLRNFCETQPKADFPEAVQELYQTLRTVQK